METKEIINRITAILESDISFDFVGKNETKSHYDKDDPVWSEDFYNYKCRLCGKIIEERVGTDVVGGEHRHRNQHIHKHIDEMILEGFVNKFAN